MVLAGLKLITPDAARTSEIVRTKAFLSDDEISQVEAAANEVNALNPVPNWDTVYLQSEQYFKLHLADIYAKIQKLVVDVDAQHWGMLPELEKQMGSTDGVNARCVEFHEYGKHARRTCGLHIDSGSVFTVDIMLSSTSDFDGGEFATDSAKHLPSVSNTCSEEDPSQISTLKVQTFEKGDAIVFVSHKRHSVTPVTSGTRRVLVLEFWEGSECKGPHRCMNPACGWEYDLDSIEC
jgi:hypothetical protein